MTSSENIAVETTRTSEHPTTRITERPTKIRFFVLALLYFAIAINYVDRVNMGLAAPVIQTEMHIDAAMMGLIFSIFGWLYMLMQLPSGAVLDRFGTRKTFGWALFLWSGCTCLFGLATNAIHLLLMRLFLGTTEAPCMLCAQRVIAAWFPRKERGTAVGIYASAQFVGMAFLSPVLAYMVSTYGWPSIFWFSGGLGILYAVYWYVTFREPGESKRISQAELAYLRAGGAVTDFAADKPKKFQWATLIKILAMPSLWGLYAAKFSYSATLWFFFTWFPSYLVREKHLTLMQAGWWTMLPFFCAMLGILLAGLWSDVMSRRGVSHATARKLPVATGMALITLIIAANYIDDPLPLFVLMSVVFFGQGMAMEIDALMCDTLPAESFGLTVGVCATFANFGGAMMPLVLGLIIQATGSYVSGIAFVSAMAIICVVSVAFIKKVEPITL
jgi:ACS family D-galactonate transporter-like MFS transporter